MTRKIRPFEPKDQEYTIVDNVIFDYIMPSLSPNAWKVLCLILRKTRGWHKEWDGLAYSQIKEGTGIKSDPTVNKALNELLEKEFIRQVKGDKWDAAQYALNTTIEIEVENGSATENIVEPTIENEVEPTIESKDTKQTMKQTKKQKERGAAEKTPPAPPDLPRAFDGHQRAVDKANGGNGADPIDEIIRHLRWMCTGPGSPMPKGKELGSYRKAARALLEEKINTEDWQSVCFAIDDWSENPPEADVWQRDRTNNPHKALDCITSHYWRLKNGGKPNARSGEQHTEHQKRIAAALRATARNPGG